ncbi:MAG: hypothetical protein K2X38_06635 [Gemmataceae bacterium]|nr:hypothetical protein [Gemmataceae bacterium]
MYLRRIVWLTALLVCFGLVAPASAQAPRPKDLQWTHAFDLACRKLGENDFTEKTQKFGVEAFRDANNSLGLYLSQTGSLAAAPNFADLKIPLTPKSPDWVTGFDLQARKAGEKEFSKTTKTHAMEVFRDPNVGNWIYVTDKGAVATTTSKTAPAGAKASKWVHSVDLSVRKGGVKDWKDATKYGIEVYRDNSSGNLVYICDTGSIAVIPDTSDGKSDGKAPEWLHGLDLKVRKANEPSFTKETKIYGVEVFRDGNNANLIFLCETGSIAVAAGPQAAKAPTTNVKEPVWTHGINVKCRKYGEKEFTGLTQTFGAEVFRDDNVGVTVYIGETGTLTAIATKQ